MADAAPSAMADVGPVGDGRCSAVGDGRCRTRRRWPMQRRRRWPMWDPSAMADAAPSAMADVDPPKNSDAFLVITMLPCLRILRLREIIKVLDRLARGNSARLGMVRARALSFNAAGRLGRICPALGESHLPLV